MTTGPTKQEKLRERLRLFAECHGRFWDLWKVRAKSATTDRLMEMSLALDLLERGAEAMEPPLSEKTNWFVVAQFFTLVNALQHLDLRTYYRTPPRTGEVQKRELDHARKEIKSMLKWMAVQYPMTAARRFAPGHLQAAQTALSGRYSFVPNRT